MNNSLKSDSIVCNSWLDNNYKFKSFNDRLFLQQMMQTPPSELKKIDLETDLLTTQHKGKQYTCNRGTETRGDNARNCEYLQLVEEFGRYTRYNMQGYLLLPCSIPNYRNHLICGSKECCSNRHQIFDNMTKRK
jgi:hypothetical protein